MITLRWASGLLTILCVVLTLARLTVDGVTVLALVFLLVFTWSMGAFYREFWVKDIDDNHPEGITALDQLDRKDTSA